MMIHQMMLLMHLEMQLRQQALVSYQEAQDPTMRLQRLDDVMALNEQLNEVGGILSSLLNTPMNNSSTPSPDQLPLPHGLSNLDMVNDLVGPGLPTVQGSGPSSSMESLANTSLPRQLPATSRQMSSNMESRISSTATQMRPRMSSGQNIQALRSLVSGEMMNTLESDDEEGQFSSSSSEDEEEESLWQSMTRHHNHLREVPQATRAVQDVFLAHSDDQPSHSYLLASEDRSRPERLLLNRRQESNVSLSSSLARQTPVRALQPAPEVVDTRRQQTTTLPRILQSSIASRMSDTEISDSSEELIRNMAGGSTLNRTLRELGAVSSYSSSDAMPSPRNSSLGPVNLLPIHGDVPPSDTPAESRRAERPQVLAAQRPRIMPRVQPPSSRNNLVESQRNLDSASSHVTTNRTTPPDQAASRLARSRHILTRNVSVERLTNAPVVASSTASRRQSTRPQMYPIPHPPPTRLSTESNSSTGTEGQLLRPRRRSEIMRELHARNSSRDEEN